MQTTSITIELPVDVLNLLDSTTKTQLETRSHYIRTAVLEKLRQQRPKDLEKILLARSTFSEFLDHGKNHR